MLQQMRGAGRLRYMVFILVSKSVMCGCDWSGRFFGHRASNLGLATAMVTWTKGQTCKLSHKKDSQFPKGTLLRSWLTKSRPRLLLLIAGLKRPQVTLMRRKRMKRTKVAKATTCSRMPHFT
ncbi:glycine N-methyltransferase isoform X1 [Lates japonicus]|uniref:Glycine N-methyltransferase isoform X1 n=1 Tax=Lates japonicus TaxID=270547 RepID=A0AAD3N4S6_LATJO|nr:glycine N-methyltransferase isoform X1 [Lates japonicus]